MTKDSEKFERKIQLIHMLIEESDSEVEWNDRIPDPDNPDQPRQIDVTIKKDGKLTLVECRLHKSKQDVKWIEELIGRRTSLKADAIIAVSASGFTKGAILKADKYGVILRDILSLTEEEIRSWGNKTRVWLTFYEYSDIHVVFNFSKLNESKISLELIEDFLIKYPDKFYGMFEVAAGAIDKNNITDKKVKFNASLVPKGVLINGCTPLSVAFAAFVRSIKEELNIPSVVVYDNPETDALERNVFVEAVELGDFEITQSNNNVMVSLDLSPIKIPPNCQFRFVSFDFNRAVAMTGARIIGLPKFIIPIDKFALGVNYV